MIRTLRPEGDTAGDLGVGPDLTLKRLNCEDLILEQHWVVINSFPDALILPLERGDGLLLVSLSFELHFILIVGVITVK